MLESLLLMVLLGCLIGVFTGLVPGLHVNTVALIALNFAVGNNFGVTLMFTAMAVVHSFVDFVPSVLLGAPSSDSFLALLPGHKMLMQGKAQQAIMLTVVGGLFGTVLSLAVSPILVLFIYRSSEMITDAVPYALLLTMALMLASEKEKGKKALFWASTVIVLSGVLGMISLNSNLSIKNPLFVLVSGFFGASTLIDSIKGKPSVKKQVTEEFNVSSKIALHGSGLSVIAACIVAMLPGIGPSLGAFLVKKFVAGMKTAKYLVVLGGINTSNMIFSFFMLFAWGKTRTGIAAAIKQLIELQPEHMIALSAVCLVAAGFGAIATTAISKKMIKAIHAFDYRKLNIAVLMLLVSLVFILSNALGMLAFATATAVGFTAIKSKTRRSNCMAFLMLPAILYYTGIAFF